MSFIEDCWIRPAFIVAWTKNQSSKSSAKFTQAPLLTSDISCDFHPLWCYCHIPGSSGESAAWRLTLLSALIECVQIHREVEFHLWASFLNMTGRCNCHSSPHPTRVGSGSRSDHRRPSYVTALHKYNTDENNQVILIHTPWPLDTLRVEVKRSPCYRTIFISFGTLIFTLLSFSLTVLCSACTSELLFVKARAAFRRTFWRPSYTYLLAFGFIHWFLHPILHICFFLAQGCNRSGHYPRNTQNGVSVHIYIHGKFNVASLSTGIFWEGGRKLENLEETLMDTRRIYETHKNMKNKPSFGTNCGT